MLQKRNTDLILSNVISSTVLFIVLDLAKFFIVVKCTLAIENKGNSKLFLQNLKIL
jgi:hypothetical protein